MSYFCTLTYTGTGTVWPARTFPAASFPRTSPARSRDAARAWTFFEQVESYDASIRVKYAALGGFMATRSTSTEPSPWYVFKDESERVMYKRGRSLHMQICPDIDWIPQRMLGIPTSPLTNVYPSACPDIINIVPTGERNIVNSPTLSANSSLIKEVTTLGNSPTSSRMSISNSRSVSRRNSISK